MKLFKRSNKVAFAVGALIGLAITRMPFMEDGNLFVTNVCALLSGSVTLVLWRGFEKIIKHRRQI